MTRAIGALVAAAVLVPGAGGAPKATPYNGRIAFPSLSTAVLVNPDGTKLLVEAVSPSNSNRTGHEDIWTMAADRSDERRLRGLADLRGTTHDRELLPATARTAWQNVRYVGVETRDSPSWVAWNEIAVFRA